MNDQDILHIVSAALQWTDYDAWKALFLDESELSPEEQEAEKASIVASVRREVTFGRPCQDDDGHWYIIPTELCAAFDEAMVVGDYDTVDADFSQYRTGGGIDHLEVPLS